MVIEALGYLGGVVVLVGVLLIAAQYWGGLSTSVRLILVASAAVALLAGGLAIPGRAGAHGARLRAVLWLLSTAAVAAFLGVLGGEALDWEATDVALLVGAGTTVYAGALWLYRSTLIQQFVLFVATLVTAGSAAAELNDPGNNLPGLAVWGGGAVWFLLGWGGIVPGRRATIAAAAAALLVGSVLTMGTDAGMVFALLTVALLVAVAIVFGDLIVLAVSAWGALQVLPTVITDWFPGRLAAPVALLLVGGLLVGVAIFLANRGRPAEGTAAPARDLSHGTPRLAAVLAAAVAVVVTAILLVLGLS
jgi:hypothetical protein